MIDDWKADITEEKNLADVYRKSRALLASRFNRFAIVATALITLTVALYWIANEDWENSLKVVQTTTDISFNLTVQILGFLIGGFAIFATVSDYNLMIMLAKTEMKKTGISVFKTIFFNFLSVFYIYVLTLAVAVSVKLLSLIRFEPLYAKFGYPTAATAAAVNSIASVALVCLLALCIIRLKSFIWNIYTAFIIFLSVADLQDKVEKK